VLNKVFHVFPEILIGAAIDAIVNADDSFVADLTGINSRWRQLVALALVNTLVWLLESATE
jgi:ATP-binding cassette subfamily B protein